MVRCLYALSRHGFLIASLLVVLAARSWATGLDGTLGLRLIPFSPSAEDTLSVSSTVLSMAASLVCVFIAVGCVLVGRGRGHRRMLERSLAHERVRYDYLVEQTSDVVLRLSGSQMTISSSVEALTGYTSHDLRGLGMAALVHPDDLAAVRAAYSALGAGDRRRDLTYRLIHRNGATVWVEARFGWLETTDGRPESIVTLRNVTEQRVEAEALKNAMQAARAAQKSADDANRAKGDFLASMSHEIRTPLNAIIGFADLQLAMQDLPPTARRHTERMRAGGGALLTIVNDILDFAQAESGHLRLDPRPFALPLLVDECIALVENAAVAKALALKVELDDQFPIGLMGDEGRLRQILLNLLNNAIKFTAQGSVTLRIGYDRMAGRDRVRFEIADTGIGIAADHLPHLFQRFHQVDGSIRRSYGGSGLGLAISKMLVELMGGSIEVRSTKEVGSTFVFSLDLPTTSLVLEPATARDLPSRALTILLVEDMPINQELARAVLVAKGHKVDIVGDGAEAIMAVETFDYDLVLMDIQMPFVDGLSATRAIRLLRSPRRFVPIVAMTANVMKSQVADAFAAGMDDILAKPLSLDAMQALLERAAQGAVRADPNGALDYPVLAKLVAVIGQARAKTMLAALAVSLSERFTQPMSMESLPSLKADAHACMASASALGFTAFASLCRRFIIEDDMALLAEGHAALSRELGRVVDLARHLSSRATVLDVELAA